LRRITQFRIFAGSVKPPRLGRQVQFPEFFIGSFTVSQPQKAHSGGGGGGTPPFPVGQARRIGAEVRVLCAEIFHGLRNQWQVIQEKSHRSGEGQTVPGCKTRASYYERSETTTVIFSVFLKMFLVR
jgi:hypothetical protein